MQIALDVRLRLFPVHRVDEATRQRDGRGDAGERGEAEEPARLAAHKLRQVIEYSHGRLLRRRRPLLITRYNMPGVLLRRDVSCTGRMARTDSAFPPIVRLLRSEVRV